MNAEQLKRRRACRMARLVVQYRRDRQVRDSELGSGQTVVVSKSIMCPKYGEHTMLSSKSACMFLFLRRSKNQTNARIASRPTTPPTTPPAIAPTS